MLGQVRNRADGTTPQSTDFAGATPPVVTDRTTGHLYALKTGDIPVDQKSGILSVKDFGATADGADDSEAFNDFFDALAAAGGVGTIPKGTYLVSSQVTLTLSTGIGVTVFAYGATIETSGAISGLKVTGSAVPVGSGIYGLNIKAKSGATAGFDISRTANLALVDCSVTGVNASAAYIAFWLHQSDAANPDTASFWTTLTRCNVRNNAGNIAYGVKLQGAVNATTLRDCVLSPGVGTCVWIGPESGGVNGANGILIDGCRLENFTTGVHVDLGATGSCGGLRITNNRGESGTTFFSYTGSMTQPPVPPWLSGNYLISSVTTYINNPNALKFNNFDFSITPELAEPHLVSPLRLVVEGYDSTEPTLDVRIPNVGEGLRMTLNDASVLWDQKYAASGKIETSCGAGVKEYKKQVGGLSATTTRAENLRGQVTFTSGSTKAVSFATAEPDASYFITLGGNVDERFWVTNKATLGFTINSSNATSTAVVDWHLIR
jgi:hypothetical protein